ncbi:Diaminobutyrate--2-oxoglutarate transaminase [Novipirellula galeiformis]|uniref:Diaminobutyrate--2-oxoglutarate transaminase n=1 Tax=Novipirellula galeiformis TaxID=2528004 RepID=A0A5C6CQ37_9BACT|nr:diaminobutyrate--2-oxoglutarate transaminase [Novipirellula galeiformis]TWU26610.1 Diaminobutyrate--2-oxoglutarate transaminase [Novipirellula galeiformis]
MQDPIEPIESNVRGYARLFPTVFDTAVGSTMTDTHGKSFIDFFCGAGSLNYGHNNRQAKQALLAYIERDGIQHSLDTVTSAKVDFLDAFERIILRPRKLDYRIQFTGPTGTNAVEAAVKLARKQTQRSHVVAFTNAYHGHSLGALALTGNQFFHSEYYGSHNDVTHLPFDGYMGDLDTSTLFEKMLNDPSSGLPLPAAVILETIQGEGGINVASDAWLRRIASLCKQHGIHLIVDDIQVGNGRSGKFFSFEHAGIVPDMVCISKSIGGGLPMSLVLIRPEIDVWKPGEHTGTFRGNNLAFISARAVLEYWNDSDFEQQIEERSQRVQTKLHAICAKHSARQFRVRGRGLIWGLDLRCGDLASETIAEAFKHGLLIEGAGAHDQVLKVMPALTIETSLLEKGLQILESAVDASLFKPVKAPAEVFHTASMSVTTNL